MSQHRILIVLSENGFAASASTDAGSPVPLDLEHLAEFVPAINAASLSEIDRLKAVHAEEITKLREQLATASATPATGNSTLLADLDAAFEEFPDAVQTAFEVPWVTVRNLMQAGKSARAYRFVQSLPVPPELEASRASILAKIAE